MKVKVILNWVTTSILTLFVILTVFVMASTYMNNGKASIFGKDLLVVLSGSMSPTFDTGSLIAVSPIHNFSDIKQGDIITFKALNGVTVTHRAYQIEGTKIITKGDANQYPDQEPVTPDRIVGKVSFWIPYLGYLVEFIRSKQGMLLFLGVPGIYLIFSSFWKLFKAFKNEEQMQS